MTGNSTYFTDSYKQSAILELKINHPLTTSILYFNMFTRTSLYFPKHSILYTRQLKPLGMLHLGLPQNVSKPEVSCAHINNPMLFLCSYKQPMSSRELLMCKQIPTELTILFLCPSFTILQRSLSSISKLRHTRCQAVQGTSGIKTVYEGKADLDRSLKYAVPQKI